MFYGLYSIHILSQSNASCIFILIKKVKYTSLCSHPNSCKVCLFTVSVKCHIQNKDGDNLLLIHSISTVQFIFVCPLLASFFCPNQKFVLLLNNLDDVLVLHDVRQANSLRAVLGTGSL